MPPTRRRATLLLMPLAGLAVARCAGREDPASPAPPPPGPIGYRYLTPLPLNVASLEVAEGDPPPLPGDIGATLSPRPAEAVRVMARDRLSAVGTQGRAVFGVTGAALTRAPAAGGGAGLACALGCRLEILSSEGARLGFVEAEARAGVSGAEAARAGAADRLLRRAMDGLNVEFEYQMRRNLRDWLVAVAPGSQGAVPAPPAGAVTREDLPRS